MLAGLARLLLSVSCSPREHHMAYLVEIWLLTVMDIPGKSRNEHLLAGSMSLQQLFPNSDQVWGLLLTVHVRARVHFRKICDCVGRSVGQSTFFLVRRLWGGLGRWSGGVAGRWGGAGQ